MGGGTPPQGEFFLIDQGVFAQLDAAAAQGSGSHSLATEVREDARGEPDSYSDGDEGNDFSFADADFTPGYRPGAIYQVIYLLLLRAPLAPSLNLTYEDLYNMPVRRFLWTFGEYSKLIKKVIPKNIPNQPGVRGSR